MKESIQKNTEKLREQAQQEYAASVVLQNEADIAYLAMMQGIKLASDEEQIEGGIQNV